MTVGEIETELRSRIGKLPELREVDPVGVSISDIADNPRLLLRMVKFIQLLTLHSVLDFVIEERTLH